MQKLPIWYLTRFSYLAEQGSDTSVLGLDNHEDFAAFSVSLSSRDVRTTVSQEFCLHGYILIVRSYLFVHVKITFELSIL